MALITTTDGGGGKTLEPESVRRRWFRRRLTHELSNLIIDKRIELICDAFGGCPDSRSQTVDRNLNAFNQHSITH